MPSARLIWHTRSRGCSYATELVGARTGIRPGSRADRARVYEIVLQEGRPADILAYVDGALLVDLWDDLVLPRAVRSAWAPVIQPSRGMAA